MKSGIYEIRSKLDNKTYIGSSQDLDLRKKQHFNSLKSNKHQNNHLQRAYNKYGIFNFEFSILEECDINVLIIKEQFYIDNSKFILYNLKPEASGMRGYKHSEKCKKSIRETTKRIFNTEEKRKERSFNAKGENNSQSKLNIAKVKEIRGSTLKDKELSILYNVTVQNIWRIRNFKSWIDKKEEKNA